MLFEVRVHINGLGVDTYLVRAESHKQAFSEALKRIEDETGIDHFEVELLDTECVE